MYTKKRGDQPDLSDPICLRPGATIETVCHGIHRSLASHFKCVPIHELQWIKLMIGTRLYGVNRANSVLSLRRLDWHIWFMMRMCESNARESYVYLTDMLVWASLRNSHSLLRLGSGTSLHNYAILLPHQVLDYHRQPQQDGHFPLMSLSILSGYVTSSPKYSNRCLDRTCFFRPLYPMSPLRRTWLSLNNFLKSR